MPVCFHGISRTVGTVRMLQGWLAEQSYGNFGLNEPVRALSKNNLVRPDGLAGALPLQRAANSLGMQLLAAV
jgi:hypothetical protein